MQKQLKQNFIQLPLNNFKKKSYPIPHFLFETKLQRSAKNLAQIKKIIQSQQYQYIGQVSPDRNIYCCKITSTQKLVIIQVKQASPKNKCIYVSINLTPSLKKQIKPYFMLKNWKLGEKICLLDQKANAIVLLEYAFVQMDLRNLIKNNFQQGLNADPQLLNSVIKQLFQNLCSYHLSSIAAMDIRPETIFFQDGKWFILNGDYTIVHKSAQFGSSMSKPVSIRLPYCQYLSPLMFQSWVKSQLNIIHNPFKSDVYSLGLIIYQLLSMCYTDPLQQKRSLQVRKNSNFEPLSYPCLNLRQKLLITQSHCYLLPNILQLMLKQNQDDRVYIIQACISLNMVDQLFRNVIVPFEKFFKKQVFQIQNSNRKKISYPYVGVQYQGQTIELNEQTIKHGRGTVYHNNIRTFDGQWDNNVPHGKCNISFGSMWNYQGQLDKGLFQGQGMLTFNGIRIGGTKWIKNIQQQLVSTAKQPQKGYYFVLPEPRRQKQKKKTPLLNQTNTFQQKQKQKHIKKATISIKSAENYEIYFQKISNEKTSYIINFMLVNEVELPNLLQILLNKKLFLRNKIQTVKLYQNVKYERYNGKLFDLIRLKYNKNQNISLLNIQNDNLKHQYETKINQKQCFNFPHEENHLTDKYETIDLILPNEKGPKLLLKILKIIMNQNKPTNQYIANQQIQTLKLDLSGSLINQDLFRDILDIGIHFSGLNISHCLNLTDNSMRHVSLSQSCLKSLKYLNISHLKITDKSIQELRFTSLLKNLIYLNISNCFKLTNQKISQFLCDQKFIKLQALEIAGLGLTHRGLQKFIQHGKMFNLINFNIGMCHQIGDASLIQLIKCPQMRNLKCFQCYSTTVKDIFLEVLANSQDSQNLPMLECLNLSGSINLSIYGISKFFLSSNSKNIKRLNLSNLDINDEFIELASKKSLFNPQLTQLSLSSCYKVTDKSIKQLLKSQKLIHLKKLDLSRTNISNDALLLLSQASERKLNCLKLYKCTKMNDSGFQKFLSSTAIETIKSLDIGGTNIKSSLFYSLLSQKNRINIEELYLNDCQQIEQKALCMFLLSKRAAMLRLLDISSTRCSSKVLQSIKTNPYLCNRLVHLKTSSWLIKHEQQQSICLSNLFLKKCSVSLKMLKQSPLYLSQNPLLLKLTELEINSELVNCQFLFQSSFIINLSKLRILWQQSTLALDKLSNGPAFTNFKELSLVGCKFQENYLANLLKTHVVKNIQTLDLSWTQISNQTLANIASSQYLLSLRNLNLSKCICFNDKGMIKLLMSNKLSLLFCLDVRSTLITNSSIQALSKTKHCKSLGKLILRSCPNITQIGFKQFFNTNNCSNLKQLDIAWTRISGNIFSSMSKSKYLQLNTLRISGLKGVQFQFCRFVQTMACSSITQLQLNYTQLTCNTLNALTKSRTLQTLEIIQLLGFQLNAQKLQSLNKMLQSTNLNKLKKLKITNPLIERLAERLFQGLGSFQCRINKLIILGASQQIIKRGKSILKKCQIQSQQ